MINVIERWFEFVETEEFSAEIDRIGRPELLEAIQSDLLQNASRWPVIPGTGGARKGRVADPRSDRGKSAGFRYLYFYAERRATVYLLLVFSKAVQANLSPKQKKALSTLTTILRKETA